MKYLRKEFQGQLSKCLPDIRWALSTIEAWLEKSKFPELVVTGVFRTPDRTAAFYGKPRFSWHHVYAAVDFRSHHYKKKQQAELLQYLKVTFPPPFWEVLLHDVGSGDHFHIARRDFAWRKTQEQAMEGTPREANPVGSASSKE